MAQARRELSYWVCEKCRRRYDLIKPIPFSQLEKRHPDMEFVVCIPCGISYSTGTILKQAHEIEVSTLSDMKKIIVKLDHVAEMLHNMKDTFVRLERAIDDLSRR